MPEVQHSLHWQRAALQLESRLREVSGQAPERLDREQARACYPERHYVAAWRLSVRFSDDEVRRIDVVATPGFPSSPVRTALVDRPPFLTWPHIERDGVLCLLPNLADWDPDDPVEVAVNILNRSVRLVDELIGGTIVNRDFHEEFLTYWAYDANAGGAQLWSLLRPGPPSRAIAVWRGEGVELVGESATQVTDWARRRFGSKVKGQVEAAAFLWLENPPLPSDYPRTGLDLRALANVANTGAAEVLRDAACREPEALVAVLGAVGRGGAGLVAVKVAGAARKKARPGTPERPFSRGFRPGRMPDAALADRLLGANAVLRLDVRRADADWIHGRGRDARAARLLEKTVVVIGCGSIGAPLACTLSQAGASRLVLVDHEVLDWPNVGRHPLGASSVGRSKSRALAERLQADHPHLRIEGYESSAQAFMARDDELLCQADLIVAATGNWAAESALNRWHLSRAGATPILYAWTEAHACAGHGVVVVPAGGCFQCHIGRTGAPNFSVAEWPGGDATQEEPACGAHYQPYGPVELAFVTAMLAELALDCLLRPPIQSVHRICARSTKRIEELGGHPRQGWAEAYGAEWQDITVNRPWPSVKCAACGRSSSP